LKAALALAFSDRWAMISGAAVALIAGWLFAMSGQMLATGQGGGVVLLATPAKVAIFAGTALLAGVAGVVHTSALRLRLGRSGAGITATGVVFAFLGASCCTPLLWPAALSLLGVSGVTLLGVNAAIHRWFWIPVIGAGLGLTAGTWQALRAIAMPCAVVSDRVDLAGRDRNRRPRRSVALSRE